MATIAEVKAAIDACNTVIGEAFAATSAAAQKFTDAQSALRAVRDTCTDPMGQPMIVAAQEACEEAVRNAHAAIQANEIYRDGL